MKNLKLRFIYGKKSDKQDQRYSYLLIKVALKVQPAGWRHLVVKKADKFDWLLTSKNDFDSWKLSFFSADFQVLVREMKVTHFLLVAKVVYRIWCGARNSNLKRHLVYSSLIELTIGKWFQIIKRSKYFPNLLERWLLQKFCAFLSYLETSNFGYLLIF